MYEDDDVLLDELIQHGMIINFDECILHAAEHGHGETIKYLIKHGASVMCKTPTGDNLLHLH